MPQPLFGRRSKNVVKDASWSEQIFGGLELLGGQEELRSSSNVLGPPFDLFSCLQELVKIGGGVCGRTAGAVPLVLG